MKQMMIDYRVHINDEIKFVRKVIDNYEFCVREGVAYFVSCGEYYNIPIEDISQVYTY